MSSASIAPSVSSGHSANDRFAALSISMQGVPTSLGKPCPPNSRRMLQALPAAFGELAERLLETLARS